jgi:putative membrane protein
LGILPDELEQIPANYTSAIRYRSGLFDIAILESLNWRGCSALLTYASQDPAWNEENMLLDTTAAKITYVAALTLLLTALGWWLVLGLQGSSPLMSTAEAAMKDEAFVREAAHGGLAEIKLGKLAMDRGSNEGVEAFGTRMVADHTQAGDDLKEAAKKEHIGLPTDISARDHATYDRLSKLSGTDFDKAYAQEMVKDHQQDLRDFQREANHGNDDVIREFASKTVPMIQQHLDQAKEMLKAILPAGGRRTTGNPSRQVRGH